MLRVEDVLIQLGSERQNVEQVALHRVVRPAVEVVTVQSPREEDLDVGVFEEFFQLWYRTDFLLQGISLLFHLRFAPSNQQTECLVCPLEEPIHLEYRTNVLLVDARLERTNEEQRMQLGDFIRTTLRDCFLYHLVVALLEVDPFFEQPGRVHDIDVVLYHTIVSLIIHRETGKAGMLRNRE